MRRTLYLSMACLLSALSVVGQTGSRDLNPIEKQKLQLPELPGSQARASMLRSNGSVDYTKGTFIVNEDWYGHQNSSVNFLSEDGTWTYNAFQKRIRDMNWDVRASSVRFMGICCISCPSNQKMVRHL